VNRETRALSDYWGFLVKNVNEPLYLLEWIAWDSFEFENASLVSGIHSLILVYSILDLIMPLFYVICVILLTMM